MAAPNFLFRSCLAKIPSSCALCTSLHQVGLACRKKSTAGLCFTEGRRGGDVALWGKFTPVVSLGCRVQQQLERGSPVAVSESSSGSTRIRTQRRTKTSKATEEVLQHNTPEADGCEDQFKLGGIVDEVENLDDELEEELTAMTSGYIENVRVAPHSVCVGIDPDLSGAIAVLKSENDCILAEVIDVPCITVVINKRMRRRHDYQSIAALVKQLKVPEGSIAYVEQAMPFPKDGKQGWYVNGYGYGIWLGILAAAGFTVVPVKARAWKTAMRICGREFTKDDSRALASSMFPMLSAQLRRKKDHGRAEALLIAAFGKGMTVSTVASVEAPSSPDRIGCPSQPALLPAS